MKKVIALAIGGLLLLVVMCVSIIYGFVNPQRARQVPTPTIQWAQPIFTPTPYPPIIVEVTILPPQPPDVVVYVPLIINSSDKEKIQVVQVTSVAPYLGSGADLCAGLPGWIGNYASPTLTDNSLWVVECTLRYAFSDGITVAVFRGQAGELLIAKCQDPPDKIPPPGSICQYDSWANYLCNKTEWQRFLPWQWY